MAKGRKPEGAGDILSIRIPAELRRELERAAKKHGKSLNHEIRRRLAASFESDKSIEAKYGDRRVAAFFRILSLIPWSVRSWPVPTTPVKHDPSKWLYDQKLYEQTAWAIRTVLEMLEPKRSPEEKAESWQNDTVAALNNSPKGRPTPEASGRLVAGAVLHEIKNVDAQTWSMSDHVDIAINQEMKDLIDRLPDAFLASTAIRQLFTRKRII